MEIPGEGNLTRYKNQIAMIRVALGKATSTVSRQSAQVLIRLHIVSISPPIRTQNSRMIESPAVIEHHYRVQYKNTGEGLLSPPRLHPLNHQGIATAMVATGTATRVQSTLVFPVRVLGGRVARTRWFTKSKAASASFIRSRRVSSAFLPLLRASVIASTNTAIPASRVAPSRGSRVAARAFTGTLIVGV